MPPELAIVVIDLEDDPTAADGQHCAIVLTPGVVVLGEVVEARDSDQHFANSIRAERFDAAGDDDATAEGFAPQLIVQLADPGGFDRAPVDHGSISHAESRSLRLAASWPPHSTSRISSASPSGSMSRCSSSRSASYSTGCGKPASRHASQNVANGR